MNIRGNFIRISFLAILLVGLYCGIATGQEIDVYFDPGHGGTQPGVLSYPEVEGCNEKDVNLMVADKINSLLIVWFYEYPEFTYEFSRLNDLPGGDLTPQDRARDANLSGTSAFVSIHHDGNIDHTIYFTRTYYSTDTIECCDSRNELFDIQCCERATNNLKNTTATLAQKVGYKLKDAMQIAYNDPDDFLREKTVLSRTYMPSTITEAAFLSHPDETYLYCEDWYSTRVLDEAMAIVQGVTSFLAGQGLGKIDYRYGGQKWNVPNFITPTVFVENEVTGNIGYTVPYESCWLDSEPITITANDFTKELNYINYTYTFHHWVRQWYTTGWDFEENSGRSWDFPLGVGSDFDSTHYFVAYFTGGPYEVKYLSGQRDVSVGDVLNIEWRIYEEGPDTSTISTVSIQRNGGEWSDIAALPWWTSNQYFNWTVTGPWSGNCIIRVRAEDKAGNVSTAYTESFTIYDPSVDSDEDLIVNSLDNCPSEHNPDQLDSDNDGIGDECDVCPEVYDPSQADRDADWVGDLCDNCPDLFNSSFGQPGTDNDEDGVGDWCDNCWFVYNPEQVDINNNDIGDACEPCCGLMTNGYTGNCNNDAGGLRDLADITRLIDHVYITKTETAPCQ